MSLSDYARQHGSSDAVDCTVTPLNQSSIDHSGKPIHHYRHILLPPLSWPRRYTKLIAEFNAILFPLAVFNGQPTIQYPLPHRLRYPMLRTPHHDFTPSEALLFPDVALCEPQTKNLCNVCKA